MENEEEALRKLDNNVAKETILKRSPEEKISLPSCTSEGVNYVIECYTCRKSGIRRTYYGETSRSAYQRGAEHQKEVKEGILSHPLVLHFWEEHQGRRQPLMMRVISAHLTPLDRQVTE